VLNHIGNIDLKQSLVQYLLEVKNKMDIEHEQEPRPQTAESGDVDLLTVVEAAGLLRLQVSTIRAWVLHRRIPFVKLGGKRVFFRRADLHALITRSIVPAEEKEEQS
jgi:excisionase family DNA binding protein